MCKSWFVPATKPHEWRWQRAKEYDLQLACMGCTPTCRSSEPARGGPRSAGMGGTSFRVNSVQFDLLTLPLGRQTQNLSHLLCRNAQIKLDYNYS